MSSWQQHCCYRNVTYKTWAGVFLWRSRGRGGGEGRGDGCLKRRKRWSCWLRGINAEPPPPKPSGPGRVLTDIHERKLFFMLLKAVVNINGGQIINHPKRVEEERLVFYAGTSGRGESRRCRVFCYWPLVVSVGNNTRLTNADAVIFSTWPFDGFYNKSSVQSLFWSHDTKGRK